MTQHDAKAVARIVAEFEARLHALPSHKTANMRALRREFSQQLKSASPETVVAVALHLVGKDQIEYRFVGYELVHFHREALRSLRAKQLEQLGRGMDSWEDVDTFACYLSGPAWREQQVSDALIEKWARSQDRWWRRAALVSTVPLNNPARGGSGDAARTLQMCARLVGDHDDMVVKALSWALRELAKREPQAVRDFLTEHDDALAARVKREVGNKLRTGLKNPRR